MKELVFLLEEPSAKAMLESLLPRILNPGIAARLIPFEGKQDLEKQMITRIRGYVAVCHCQRSQHIAGTRNGDQTVLGSSSQRCVIDTMDFGRATGELVGTLLAPLFGAGSKLRHARFFHPEGVCYRMLVRPRGSGPLASLSVMLGGEGLMRLSSAWWRGGKEWPDILGVGLRLQEKPGAPPRPEDQDLLLATIPVPLLTPMAPLWTQVHDFLANTYYATVPFHADGVGRLRLRLRPRRPAPGGPDRVARLAQAVRDGEAVFDLEAARSLLSPYRPLAEVQLVAPLEIDQATLRLSPFRSGRGLAPSGYVNGLRKAVYAASQAARPAVEVADASARPTSEEEAAI